MANYKADTRTTHRELSDLSVPPEAQTEKKNTPPEQPLPNLDQATLESSYKVQHKTDTARRSVSTNASLKQALDHNSLKDQKPERSKNLKKHVRSSIRNKSSHSLIDHLITFLARMLKMLELKFLLRMIGFSPPQPAPKPKPELKDESDPNRKPTKKQSLKVTKSPPVKSSLK